MKTRNKLPKPKSNGSHIVHLEIVDQNAREVFVAGSFNDWRANVSPMINLGGGRWGKELSLTPGRYEYLFVVDGHWTGDPAAKEAIPNPYGGLNSILSVPLS